jgi:hypothetical protein
MWEVVAAQHWVLVVEEGFLTSFAEEEEEMVCTGISLEVVASKVRLGWVLHLIKVEVVMAVKTFTSNLLMTETSTQPAI